MRVFFPLPAVAPIPFASEVVSVIPVVFSLLVPLVFFPIFPALLFLFVPFPLALSFELRAMRRVVDPVPPVLCQSFLFFYLQKLLKK